MSARDKEEMKQVQDYINSLKDEDSKFNEFPNEKITNQSPNRQSDRKALHQKLGWESLLSVTILLGQLYLFSLLNDQIEHNRYRMIELNQDVADFHKTIADELNSIRKEIKATHDGLDRVRDEISDLKAELPGYATFKQVERVHADTKLTGHSLVTLGTSQRSVEHKLDKMNNFLTKYTWHSIPRETSRKIRDSYEIEGVM